MSFSVAFAQGLSQRNRAREAKEAVARNEKTIASCGIVRANALESLQFSLSSFPLFLSFHGFRSRSRRKKAEREWEMVCVVARLRIPRSCERSTLENIPEAAA